MDRYRLETVQTERQFPPLRSLPGTWFCNQHGFVIYPGYLSSYSYHDNYLTHLVVTVAELRGPHLNSFVSLRILLFCGYEMPFSLSGGIFLIIFE